MARAFWKPYGRNYSNMFKAEYRSKVNPDIWFTKTLSSGAEREEFIREQSHIIRRFETEQEYLDFYSFLSTMVS